MAPRTETPPGSIAAMLVIPFDRPIDWRRPPVVTLLLVATNVLVFVLFQVDDGREMQAVKGYYYESGLSDIELPRYRAYLERHGTDEFVQRFGERLDDPRVPWFERLLTDDDFNRRLAAGRVITAGDERFARWRRLRQAFERRLDDTTVWGLGLRPVRREPLTFLTHMFLHGGVFHLFGNMVFLVAVGLLVEVALGSLVLTGLYLLSGIGAAGLFIALDPGGVAPLVGASGAIAGLMGLCGVLYGRRRIRFFYSIGVYFDYVKAPGLALLALWFGKELFQYLEFSELGNVAYAAHMGGILTGAFAGVALRLGTDAVDEEALDERDRTEVYQRRLQEANERLDAMEPERARALFQRMLRDYPGDTLVLDGLFRASRFAPASKAYHDVVRRILGLPATQDAATLELVLTAFRDYRARARPRPRLDAAAIQRMIELLLQHGTAEEAAPLVGAALKRADRFPGIEDQAMRLARVLERAGRRDQARKLCAHLVRCFPGTGAARAAEHALASISS